jgi:hypothetical protein
MPLSDQVIRDGDQGFIGFASRLNPLTLPAGVLQLSENMRLDRGVAQTRKGAKRMADGISIASAPLTVPFVLTAAPSEPIVRSVYTGGVLASCVFRSPDAINSNEIVVLAGGDRAYALLLDDSEVIAGVWSGGLWVAIGGDEIVTNDGDNITFSALSTEITYPTTPDEIVEPSDKVSMAQAFDRLYLLREADNSRTEYNSRNVTAGGITVSTTTATVNLTAHGYPVGARVRIVGSSTAAFDGHEYDIVTAATDSFTITVPAGTATDSTTSGRTVRRVKAPLYWDGTGTAFVRSPAGVPSEGPSYRRMPSVAWASYINNRLILPDGRDQVMLSDILEPNLYDPFWQSFRANAGSNDVVVAVHAWVDNSALVFCRKSIWLATISQSSSVDGTDMAINTTVSNLALLTDEVGCAARRTIQTAGQFVYFLSDAGVYRLDARLDLKLRGDTRPLSDSIADKLQELNASLLSNSVGLWYNNRYFLAVPLAGADNNNGVFIYNAINGDNGMWETRDIYGFGVDNFLVATYQNERRLFVTNQGGKLFMLDELEAGDDAPDSNVDGYVGTVAGRIITRRLNFGEMSSKRFLRSVADVIIPNGGGITTEVSVIDPDKTETIGSITNSSGATEDYHLKSPIRFKAHAAELTFTTTGQRPQIRSAAIEASPKSLPATLTRNES